MVLFWRGPFSNWYMRDMLVYGIEYNCVEQFMMSQKARMFYDVRCEQTIMASNSPKQQKWLGRQVQGFDKEKWDRDARDIVGHAVFCKFNQHEDLKNWYEDLGLTIPIVYFICNSTLCHISSSAIREVERIKNENN